MNFVWVTAPCKNWQRNLKLFLSLRLTGRQFRNGHVFLWVILNRCVFISRQDSNDQFWVTDHGNGHSLNPFHPCVCAWFLNSAHTHTHMHVHTQGYRVESALWCSHPLIHRSMKLVTVLIKGKIHWQCSTRKSAAVHIKATNAFLPVDARLAPFCQTDHSLLIHFLFLSFFCS